MTKPTQNEFLMLFRGKSWDRGLSPEELQQVVSQVTAWIDGLKQSGKVKGGQVLSEQGRTVSGQNGRMIVDGPYAESKESVGGSLLLEVDDMDEAVAIAQSCPTLVYGVSIEIRPVLDECPTMRRALEQLADAGLSVA